MKKRMLSLIMVLIMVFGMMPVSAMAVDAHPNSGYNTITANVPGEITVERSSTARGTYGAFKADVYPCVVTVPAGTTEIYVVAEDAAWFGGDYNDNDNYYYDAETDIEYYKLKAYSYDINSSTLTKLSSRFDAMVDYDRDPRFFCIVTIPIKDFMEASNRYVALMDADGCPFDPLTFRFAEAEASHEHSYKESITTAATCGAAGVKTFTCSDCGDRYTEEIAATGEHSFVNGSCSVCGEADPNYVAPAAHPFVSVKADGKAVADSDIESKGTFALDGEGSTMYPSTYYETEWYHITVPAGTENVETTYASDADIYYFQHSDGSPAFAGYDAGIDADAVDAMTSATVKNRTLYNHGSVNSDGSYTVRLEAERYALTDNVGKGFALEKKDYSPITMVTFGFAPCPGHVYETVTTEATCTEDGSTVTTCTICGDSSTEVIPAAGHSFADGTCTVCGAADPDYVAPAPGVTIPDGAPFTAVEGAVSVSDEGTVSCNGTDAPYYNVVVPAGTGEIQVTFPAEADVFFDASYNNAVYGYYIALDGSDSGMPTMSGAEGENGAIIVNVPLSLTAMDYNTYEEVTLSFLKDDGYAIGPETNNFAPICFFTFEYAPAAPGSCEHSYSESITTEPTCGAAGEKTFTCSKCSESYTEPVPATGEHSYSESITTAPTCGKSGVKTFTCTACGDSYTESIPATGEHTETAVVTAPTCTKNGYTTYTCSVCGASRTADSVPPTGEHKYAGGFCADCGAADPSGAPDLTDGVYRIGTADELLWFAGAVNNGETAIQGALTSDIDLTGKEWPGIGTSSKPFAGSFDGNGKTVDLGNAGVGLFGQVKGSASNRVEVKNVTVEGSITATVSTGGIAGNAQYANFTACVNRADVTVSGANKEAAGITTGLGYNSMNDNGLTITNCGNEGNITSSSYSGGILSTSRGGAVITNCYNTGNIKGSSAAGGMVGYFQGYKGTCSITGCYNSGSMTAGSKGGLVGSAYNNCSISNSYNIGENYYAIVGHAYNGTNTVSNCYYLATASTEAAPAGKNITATALSGKEMSSADFVTKLADANFKQSCPAPVFTWQSAAEHSMENGSCTACGYGSLATFDVTLPSSEMYTVTGDSTVTEGGSYSFLVTIAEDYQAGNGFAVRVNGEAVTAINGVYTVTDVKGPLVITVEGVEKIPDDYAIHLPDFMGNGYRVTAAEGSSNPAPRGGSYSFTVTFPNGFRAGEDFAVRVNGNRMAAENGVYTIANVQAEQTISVEGVEAIPTGDTTSVTITISSETMDFYRAPDSGVLLLLKNLEVPYFDLGLYGLQKYYYHPNSYGFTPYRAGDRELAYGVVTGMHAFIYATEVFYLNYEEKDAGLGISYRTDTDRDGKSDFEEAISWTGGAGSSFMNLWGRGTNLNYYADCTYPMSSLDGIGSTSDQIPVYDGYKIDLHFIENSDASGSDYGYLAVNDQNGIFDGKAVDTVDFATVKQGDELTLTMFTAGEGSNYETIYWTTEDRKVYWTEASNVTDSITGWKRTDFGGLAADTLVIGENGLLTLDTTKIEPGTYYIAAEGGFREDNHVDNDGFKHRGKQAGPAVLCLTVEACEHSETETVYEQVADTQTHSVAEKCSSCGITIGEVTVEDCVDEDGNNLCDLCEGEMGAAAPVIVLGDANGDGTITAADATLTLRYVKNKLSESLLSSVQVDNMDVSGDGSVTSSDAMFILRFVKNKLDKFPADTTDY